MFFSPITHFISDLYGIATSIFSPPKPAKSADTRCGTGYDGTSAMEHDAPSYEALKPESGSFPIPKQAELYHARHGALEATDAQADHRAHGHHGALGWFAHSMAEVEMLALEALSTIEKNTSKMLKVA